MFKLFIAIFIVGLWPSEIYGQVSSCDSVYTFVDQMPTFRNGDSDLLIYLNKNLKFRERCRPEELKRLIWTIDKDGNMTDIDLIGLEDQCKTDIIEQLKNIPIWSPGQLNGEFVCVKMMVPINITPRR